MSFLMNRYLFIMIDPSSGQSNPYANLMLGVGESGVGSRELGVRSRELGVGSSESGVKSPSTQNSRLQTQYTYCAREIRICTPARVLVMGGEVDILGVTRLCSK